MFASITKIIIKRWKMFILLPRKPVFRFKVYKENVINLKLTFKKHNEDILGNIDIQKCFGPSFWTAGLIWFTIASIINSVAMLNKESKGIFSFFAFIHMYFQRNWKVKLKFQICGSIHFDLILLFRSNFFKVYGRIVPEKQTYFFKESLHFLQLV